MFYKHHSSSCLLLIRSFSNLQVMRKCIISWMSSNFCQIRLLAMELAALDHLKKNSHTLIMGERRYHIFSAVFDSILFILAGNENIHRSLNEL